MLLISVTITFVFESQASTPKLSGDYKDARQKS